MRNETKLKYIAVIALVIGCAGPALADKYADDAARKSVARRQRAEFLSFFLKPPSEAEIPKATLAVESYNRAVEYYQNKDYNLARKSLQESLRHDKSSWFAHELLGDIYYAQQKLNMAKKHYEKAYRLMPKDSVRQKIDKLNKEVVVEKKLSTYLEEHFIIKYHRDSGRFEGYELRELLRKIYRSLSKDFGHYFKHKVVVLLYNEQEYRKVTNLPHWVAGSYDGKVRMPAYKGSMTDKELDALATHEVTHAFVAGMSGGRAPAWINEGLAEYQEFKVQKKPLSILKSAVKSNTLLPMTQLISHGGPMSLRDPSKITLFYQQSHSLVSYMIKRYRMFKIKKLLEEFGKGKDSDQALRSVLRISPQRLEKEWKASL